MKKQTPNSIYGTKTFLQTKKGDKVEVMTVCTQTVGKNLKTTLPKMRRNVKDILADAKERKLAYQVTSVGVVDEDRSTKDNIVFKRGTVHNMDIKGRTIKLTTKKARAKDKKLQTA